MCGRVTLLAALLGCVALAPQASAQICGDASGDGQVTLSDPVAIINHVAISGQPIDESTADCDGYGGVTLGDAQTLFKYMFQFIDERDCTPDNTYSFAPAVNDTIFLPQMIDIGANIDSVSLTLIASFEQSTGAFLLPLLGDTSAWGGYFYPKRVEHVNYTYGLRRDNNWLLSGNEPDPAHNNFDGRHEFFTIVLYRHHPGIGSITCESIQISTLLRPYVQKSTGDLLVPVISYQPFAAPVPTVTVDPAALSFIAMAGGWSYTSETISFASDQGIVSFSLETSDDWIVIEDFQAGGYSTPCTITVRCNATTTPMGDYTGSVVVTNPEPADAVFSLTEIPVSLHVGNPLAYPPGDVNCDGIVSIGDISRMIDFLFISETPIDPCP